MANKIINKDNINTYNSSDESDFEKDDMPDISSDISRLKPFDFEPRVELGEISSSDEEIAGSEVNLNSRIGNIDWCVCGGHCRPMESFTESLCCRETNEIPDDFFKTCYTIKVYVKTQVSCLDQRCISLSSDFELVCLKEPVLEVILSALNNLRGDRLIRNNREIRYAAYKSFTWWVHNRLGKGVRKAIPSCALWKIRDKFPSPDNLYIPFMESKIEENKLIGEEEEL